MGGEMKGKTARELAELVDDMIGEDLPDLKDVELVREALAELEWRAAHMTLCKASRREGE